jgi:hypothetical protein
VSLTANTTISVLRGTITGDYGDDLDSDEAVTSGIPASILELPVTGGRPVSGRADTPRTHTLRLWRVFAFRQSDRIKDERTGDIYSIITLVTPRNNVGLGSTRADLQRVT